MADTKKPSLTVLGGPMAGTRFVFEDDAQDITIGSDEGSAFRLQLPGVSADHARIAVEAGGVTIHDAGSERGLHVNDNRVGSGGTPLRNGDIVWLGTPGDAEVVMLQCILPRIAAAPAAAAPLELAPEDETATLALEPDSLFGAETVIQPAPPAHEPSISLEQEFVLAEEPAAAAEAAAYVPDDEATHVVASPAPHFFEDETDPVEPAAFVVAEEASTVVIDAAEVTGSLSVEPTVAMYAPEPAPEATIAMVPPEPAATVMVTPPPAPPKAPALKPRAPAAEPSPRPAAAARPPAARPASSPRLRAQPAERPASSPRLRAQPAERPAAAPARAAPSGGSSMGLYAGIGIAALLVLGGGGYAAWRYLAKKPAPPVAQATPEPPAPGPVHTPPPVSQATPPPQVEETLAPEPVGAAPATPPPLAASPSPKASAAPAGTPSPSPSASPKKASPTPPPASTPSGPSPEALRAQQVAALMGQAEAALGARQYDQAIGHFDEVLRLEPQNGKATADRASAVALRDASRKKFVAGRTVVKTEKASGGLAGFDSGDVAVQKAPDFLGRIEFDMAPATGIRPGDAYTLKFFLVNEGKKSIRIQGITATTVVNGTGAGTPVSSATKEVAPQQRSQLGEVSGSWKDGTTAWSAEVLVTANKGDSLKNTITWR